VDCISDIHYLNRVGLKPVFHLEASQTGVLSSQSVNMVQLLYSVMVQLLYSVMVQLLYSVMVQLLYSVMVQLLYSVKVK